jgi:tetratricopeptide (TPR) repeat protein
VAAPATTAAGLRTAPRVVPDDDDIVVALTRGHALFERGEVAAAIPIYEELTRSRADIAEPWLFLGIARFVQGDVGEAAKALRSSLCLAPALWPADFYLARAYERLGRGAEALHHYDLVAANEQKPLALRSVSAVINELRALRHDFQTAARRVFAERSSSLRRKSK